MKKFEKTQINIIRTRNHIIETSEWRDSGMNAWGKEGIGEFAPQRNFSED